MREKIPSSLPLFHYIFVLFSHVWREKKILLFKTRTNCCHLLILEKRLTLSEGKTLLASMLKVNTQIQPESSGLHLPQSEP